MLPMTPYTSQPVLTALLLSIILSLLPSLVLADSIRRIVHPDGRIEFTNIPSQPMAGTGAGRHGNESVYRYRNSSGVLAFSNVKPQGVPYEVLRFDCYACKPNSTINWHNTRLFLTPFQDEINTAARQFNLDPALVRAVIHAESAFNPKAISPKGAQGLMQLMPGTAAELGVSNAMDVAENIRGGANYLAQMLKQHNNDITLATAAYNAGPGAVRQYGGIPPFAETRAYVERVGILHQRYRDNGQ